MSLLDILGPSDEAIEAAKRFTPARTVVRILPRDEKRKLLRTIKKQRHRARGREKANPKQLARLQEWVKNNPEAHRKAQKAWAQNNKDRINAASRNYRARKREGLSQRI